MCLADHERQVFIEQGFTLKIELNDESRFADLGEGSTPYVKGHEAFGIPGYRFTGISKSDRTGRAAELADIRGFDGDEEGRM
jgi:hypothetical protein